MEVFLRISIKGVTLMLVGRPHFIPITEMPPLSGEIGKSGLFHCIQKYASILALLL